MCAQRATRSLFSKYTKVLNGFCNCEIPQQFWKLQVLLFRFSSNVATIKMSSLSWSDSQNGGVFLWTSKHSLQDEALVHAVNVFRAICLIFCGYRAPALPRSQTLVLSESCLAAWVPLEKIDVCMPVCHNQRGWNCSMSIHCANACFILYNRLKFLPMQDTC